MPDDHDDDNGEVIDLRQRAGLRPNLQALAREQITQARTRLDLTPAEFAEAITPLLGFPVNEGMVEAWETRAVPPGDVLIASSMLNQVAPYDPSSESIDPLGDLLGQRFGDVDAVFASRAEFTAQTPPEALLENASDVRAAGLSLNVLCQQYPADDLQQLIEDGLTMRCLFLAPDSYAMQGREREEGYQPGHLSTMTDINIEVLTQRVRRRLSDEAKPRLQIATYDETIRFNLLIVDNQLAVVQPYLPTARGLESPTLLLHRRGPNGLFATFEQLFEHLWDKSEPR
jgi:DNA-binding transcriptional regulator YiaG